VNESEDFYVTAFSAQYHRCNFGAERLAIEVEVPAVTDDVPSFMKQFRDPNDDVARSI
jgi:hypothetical protein